MLWFVAILTIVLSYIVEHFVIGFMFHLSTTVLLILRLKAVRVRFNKFVILEVLGFVIPVLFSLLFKRFSVVKSGSILVIRALFMLYVKYDYENYRYFTRTYTSSELENREE